MLNLEWIPDLRYILRECYPCHCCLRITHARYSKILFTCFNSVLLILILDVGFYSIHTIVTSEQHFAVSAELHNYSMFWVIMNNNGILFDGGHTFYGHSNTPITNKYPNSHHDNRYNILKYPVNTMISTGAIIYIQIDKKKSKIIIMMILSIYLLMYALEFLYQFWYLRDKH
ncbi:Uncharacterized protein FWK35_00007496 [Aphis craccivora]|uniref:BAH domain-containing protein n=1 Tax=Aphis craccivora TaxID=307492 RepID=A0A6G0YXF3_APHCR|nr:Uncharacterized protein FWK35_00007496 [Aphis craccivora]